MGFLLDTNTCVDYFTGRFPKVAARVQASSPEDLFVSSVVVAELRHGADHSARRRANHARIDGFVEELQVLDFDLGAAAAHGRVRARLEEGGTSIGPNDMLIAAHAVSRRLTVVTDNTSRFRRVKGLKVANWRRQVAGVPTTAAAGVAALPAGGAAPRGAAAGVAVALCTHPRALCGR